MLYLISQNIDFIESFRFKSGKNLSGFKGGLMMYQRDLYLRQRNINDSYKKVVVTKNEGLAYRSNEGFLRISLLDFLLNQDSLDW